MVARVLTQLISFLSNIFDVSALQGLHSAIQGNEVNKDDRRDRALAALTSQGAGHA